MEIGEIDKKLFGLNKKKINWIEWLDE